MKQQSNFNPVLFHNFSNLVIMIAIFFKTSIKNFTVQTLKVLSNTDDENISVCFGCIGFIDSYRFLQSSLDSLVKSVQEDGLILLH